MPPQPPATRRRSTTAEWALRVEHGHALAIACAAALIAGALAWRHVGHDAFWLTAWDAGAGTYLAIVWALVALLDARQTRQRAARQPHGGFAGFWTVLIVACASVIAGAMMLQQPPSTGALSEGAHFLLATLTVALSWLVLHTDFGLRYAARYYRARHRSERGLRFRAHNPPDCLDFMLLSFTIGVTSSVSDVEVRSRDMRGLTMLHLVLSFVFNLLVLAININLIAGSVHF